MNCDELNISCQHPIYLPSNYTLSKKYIDLVTRMDKHIQEYPKPSDKDEWIEWWCDIQVSFIHPIQDEKLNILRKHHKPKVETWNFLTLSPKPMLTLDEAEVFHNWVSSVMNPRFIEACHWVVECGKDEACPNIHTHILYKHKNHGLSKNFKRDVIRSYKKHFNGDIDWHTMKGKGWHNITIRNVNNDSYHEILKDKLEYLQDFNKSALHQNFKDLGLSGGFGRVA